MPTYQNLGFIKEFYVNRKFIGSITVEKHDHTEIGYYGAKDEVLQADVITQNKKKIKAGTTVTIMIYPQTGKWNRD